MQLDRHSLMRTSCLLVFIAVLTTSLQHWVGSATLYSDTLAAMRQETHDIIVRREAQTPDSNLLELGSYGNECRIVIPWLVEGLARFAGNRSSDIPAIYYYVDYICLYLSFLLFWLYLRHWFDELRSLLGLAYVAVALITTYSEHFFHPWDRPTFVLWIAMAMLVREDRLWAYLAVLALTLCTKFTAVLFPGFYALVKGLGWAQIRRPRFYLSLLAQGMVIVACYAFLNHFAFISGSALATSYFDKAQKVIAENWKIIAAYKFAHPVFLLIACPLMLIPFGWPDLDHYMRSCVKFAILFLLIHFLISFFVESRAQAGVLIFLMPPALRGLDALLGDESRIEPRA